MAERELAACKTLAKRSLQFQIAPRTPPWQDSLPRRVAGLVALNALCQCAAHRRSCPLPPRPPGARIRLARTPSGSLHKQQHARLPRNPPARWPRRAPPPRDIESPGTSTAWKLLGGWSSPSPSGSRRRGPRMWMLCVRPILSGATWPPGRRSGSSRSRKLDVGYRTRRTRPPRL